MRAEHVAQRRMQQVRAGVMAHGRPPHFAIDHGIHAIANHNRLPRRHLVRAHTLHRDSQRRSRPPPACCGRRVEPALVGDLPAGFGVKRRVVKHDFALLARPQPSTPCPSRMMASTSQSRDSVCR